jgi:hypothetical protein
MEKRIHLDISVMSSGFIHCTLVVIQYEEQYDLLSCFNCYSKQKHYFRKIDGETRCFDCIPWGNYKIAKEYIPIGTILCQ